MMELLFVTEARFVRNDEGEIYGEASFNRTLWQRYKTSFSKINVLARVNHIPEFVGEESKLSSTENVEFIEIPHYIGPLDYLKKSYKISSIIDNSVINFKGVIICRVPGNIGKLAISAINKHKKKYGLEIVGDPWDVFAPGTINHPLRILFRVKGYLELKRLVKNSIANLYVTENYLQKRYPSENGIFTTTASNVKVNKRFRSEIHKLYKHQNQFKIISIGSLEQMYKAPDVLLKTILILKDMGINVKLYWLGDGIFKQKMIDLAKTYNIEDRVNFVGNVSKDEVRSYLLKSDIFVLISRTEGLPRAVIEAMSLGLPCVGSKVGGIPELLDNEVLVDKNDPESTARVIEKLLSSPDFYNYQSEINFKKSENYMESVLEERRSKFYNYLIKQTNAHITSGKNK